MKLPGVRCCCVLFFFSGEDNCWEKNSYSWWKKSETTTWDVFETRRKSWDGPTTFSSTGYIPRFRRNDQEYHSLLPPRSPPWPALPHHVLDATSQNTSPEGSRERNFRWELCVWEVFFCFFSGDAETFSPCFLTKFQENMKYYQPKLNALFFFREIPQKYLKFVLSDPLPNR